MRSRTRCTGDNNLNVDEFVGVMRRASAMGMSSRRDLGIVDTVRAAWRCKGKLF